jgi:hypothetical protein
MEPHHFPVPLMILWTVLVIIIVYSLKWAVLYITDVTDPKGRKPPRVLKPGEKYGRWEMRGADQIWFSYYLLHIVSFVSHERD